MKKVLAIILCVVMLLPTFCATIYAEDPLTWEGLAEATENVDGVKPFTVSNINASNAPYTIPNLDGYVTEGEYTLKHVLRDVTSEDSTEHVSMDTSSYKAADMPDFLYVNIAEDDEYFYFGIEFQISGVYYDTSSAKYNNCIQFVLEPYSSATIPDSMSFYQDSNANDSTFALRQLTLQYRSDANWYTKSYSSRRTGEESDPKVTVDMLMPAIKGRFADNAMTHEFKLSKAALMTEFAIDSIEYFTYCLRFQTYVDAANLTASSVTYGTNRHGYGYEITQELKDAVPTFKPGVTNHKHDWNDAYICVKTENPTKPVINKWADIAKCGVPFAMVSPTTKVPSVDGTVSANEYTTKMHFTPEGNATGRNTYQTVKKLGELPDMDVYVTSNEENIYMAIQAEKTTLFDGSKIHLVASFTDSDEIKPIYNVKNPTFDAEGVSGTVNDFWTNYAIGKTADDGSNDGMVGSGSHFYFYPIVEWDNTDGQDKYTVEIVFNKEIIKLAYGLEGDVTTMHFGFWLYNIQENSSNRVCYGTPEYTKAGVNDATGSNIFTLNSSYDLDDAAATVQFLDAGANNKVDALNLAKYGQLKFYANNPTTAENAIDGVMSDGEYAFDYTFSKMRSGGSKSQWGVQLGNPVLAPAYAKIYMDHDADYFYLALRIKDTNFVPRYCGAGATYSYTEDGDKKTPADVIVDEKTVYDFYKVQIAFNNTGSIVDAAEELELQFYMNADINNDLNGDGIAQANELVPAFHVKSLVGGSEKALAGMTGAWSCDKDAMKVASNGKWDAANDELVFEVKLSKEEIAKAYGLETLGNTVSFRMNHSPWKYTGDVGFDDVAGTTTDIATGGGGGNGLKVYTGYWSGENTYSPNTKINAADFAAVKAELIAKENAESGTYFSSFDYGHVVVLGDEMAAAPVNTVDGASVRFTEGSTGMRFKTLVNKDYYDALIAKYGAENVAFGTVIAPVEYVAAAGTFTKAALDAMNPNPAGVDYLDIRTSQFYAESANTYTFLGSIANIKEVNYNRDFAAIGYVEYKDGNNTYTVYSAFYTVRSVEEVATMALNDFTTDASGACGYTVANTEIITGRTVYTPYTDAQRTIAKKFVA